MADLYSPRSDADKSPHSHSWLAKIGRLSPPPRPHVQRARLKLLVAFGIPVLMSIGAGLLVGWFADPAAAQGAAEAPKIDTGDTAWMLVSTALVLLMTPGLAFFYGGLVRSRNVLNTMMMSLIAMAVVGVTWVLWGYSLSFAPTVINPGGIPAFEANALIGSLKWFGFQGVGLDPDPVGYGATIPHQVFALYQMMFAIITVALVSGSIAERLSFKAYFWFVVLWSTLIYCPLAHWVWGKGWLGNMGALDFAGGTVVHISSGVSALVAAWMLGPRKDWQIKAIVPHNVPFVLLGTGLLWFGWFGFNAGSAIAANGLAATAFTATMVSTAAAGLTWTVVEWLLGRKPTAIGIASGFVAGLVGITPAAGFVDPLSAMAIGVITALCCLGAVTLKVRLGFDDALDTFPVHGVGGTVGAILTGVFASKSVNSAIDSGLLYGGTKTFTAGVVGVLAAYATAAIGTFLILKGLSWVMDLRVSPEVEDQGLDVPEHGEDAYGEP
nr:ammonium transporter [Limnothrix sp. FACHB-881]